MSIIFLRHGKLELPFKSHEEMPFSVLRGLGIGELNPNSDLRFALGCNGHFDGIFKKYKINTIYYADSNRCRTLSDFLILNYFKGVNLKTQEMSGLNEINFNLDILFENQEFHKLSEIGPRIFHCIFNNIEGVESIDSLLNRSDHVLKEISGGNNNDVLVLTHGYFMKILFLFLLKNESMTNIEKEKFLTEGERFNYFEGFVLDDNGNLSIIKNRSL